MASQFSSKVLRFVHPGHSIYRGVLQNFACKSWKHVTLEVHQQSCWTSFYTKMQGAYTRASTI